MALIAHTPLFEWLSHSATVLGTLLSVAGIVWRVLTNHLKHVEKRLDERLDALEKLFGGRLDGIEHRIERLEDRVDRVV